MSSTPDTNETLSESNLELLKRIGFSDVLAAAHRARAPGAGEPFRITAVHRDALTVHDGRRERRAQATTRLVRELTDDGTALAVGDWVLATPAEGPRADRTANVGDDRSIDAIDDAGNVEADPRSGHVLAAGHENRESSPGALRVQALLPRATHLVRRDGDGRRHPIVSNVDRALLVMGLDDDFNLRRLERYLTLVTLAGVAATLVLTKADIAAHDPGRRDARLAELDARHAGADLDVLAVDGTDPVTADRLAHRLAPGQTLVLLGSSGAGKSTLLNTLLGHVAQDTGPVRAHDSRGMHTTTARTLHRLPGGACVIDTPGVRTLRADADEDAIARSFGDIATLAARCRFRDCRHAGEPGCAVQDVVPADRLRNYGKLLREARRDDMGWLERRQQLSMWKSRAKAARAKRDDR